MQVADPAPFADYQFNSTQYRTLSAFVDQAKHRLVPGKLDCEAPRRAVYYVPLKSRSLLDPESCNNRPTWPELHQDVKAFWTAVDQDLNTKVPGLLDIIEALGAEAERHIAQSAPLREALLRDAFGTTPVTRCFKLMTALGQKLNMGGIKAVLAQLDVLDLNLPSVVEMLVRLDQDGRECIREATNASKLHAYYTACAKCKKHTPDISILSDLDLQCPSMAKQDKVKKELDKIQNDISDFASQVLLRYAELFKKAEMEHFESFNTLVKTEMSSVSDTLASSLAEKDRYFAPPAMTEEGEPLASPAAVPDKYNINDERVTKATTLIQGLIQEVRKYLVGPLYAANNKAKNLLESNPQVLLADKLPDTDITHPRLVLPDDWPTLPPPAGKTKAHPKHTSAAESSSWPPQEPPQEGTPWPEATPPAEPSPTPAQKSARPTPQKPPGDGKQTLPPTKKHTGKQTPEANMAQLMQGFMHYMTSAKPHTFMGASGGAVSKPRGARGGRGRGRGSHVHGPKVNSQQYPGVARHDQAQKARQAKRRTHTPVPPVQQESVTCTISSTSTHSQPPVPTGSISNHGGDCFINLGLVRDRVPLKWCPETETVVRKDTGETYWRPWTTQQLQYNADRHFKESIEVINPHPAKKPRIEEADTASEVGETGNGELAQSREGPTKPRTSPVQPNIQRPSPTGEIHTVYPAVTESLQTRRLPARMPDSMQTSSASRKRRNGLQPHQRIRARKAAAARIRDFLTNPIRLFGTTPVHVLDQQYFTNTQNEFQAIEPNGMPTHTYLPIKVHNLTSNTQVSATHMQVLNMSLGFIPTRTPVSMRQYHETMRNLLRKLAWRVYFWHRQPHPQLEEQPNELAIKLKFKVPNDKWPSLQDANNSANPQVRQLINNLMDVASACQQTLDTLPDCPQRDHNLPNTLRTALIELTTREDIVILPADKNLGPVLMDATWYIEQTVNLLHKDQNFQNYPHDFATFKTEIQKRLNPIWSPNWKPGQNVPAFSHIKAYLAHNMSKASRFASFYAIPKLHKKPVAFRPIVPNNGTILEAPAKIADHFLQPIVRAMKTHIDNSYEYIKDLKHTLETSPIIPNKAKSNYSMWMYTADVCNLYPSIPLPKAISTLLRVVRSKLPHMEEFMRILTTTALRYNTISLQGQQYRQVQGVATGSPLAPTTANLFLDELEGPILTEFRWHTNMKRYIDDIMGIFIGTPTQRKRFIHNLYAAEPSIKLDWTWIEIPIILIDQPGTMEVELPPISWSPAAIFLDIKVYIASPVYVNRMLVRPPLLKYEPYQKELNNYVYLHPLSCHPRHTITGWIKGELTRLHLRSSTKDTFQQAALKLHAHLRDRGYPDKLIRDIFNTWKPPTQTRAKQQTTTKTEPATTQTYVSVEFDGTAVQQHIVHTLKNMELTYQANKADGSMRKIKISPTYKVGKNLFRHLIPSVTELLAKSPCHPKHPGTEPTPNPRMRPQHDHIQANQPQAKEGNMDIQRHPTEMIPLPTIVSAKTGAHQFSF